MTPGGENADNAARTKRRFKENEMLWKTNCDGSIIVSRYDAGDCVLVCFILTQTGSRRSNATSGCCWSRDAKTIRKSPLKQDREVSSALNTEKVNATTCETM